METKISSVFVCNTSSARLFNSLPSEIRGVFLRRLQWIHEFVLTLAPKAFITSGYRSPRYSVSIGSHPDSWHGFGCAIDYRLGTIPDRVISVLESRGFFVLVEKTCVHVQYTGEI